MLSPLVAPDALVVEADSPLPQIRKKLIQASDSYFFQKFILATFRGLVSLKKSGAKSATAANVQSTTRRLLETLLSVSSIDDAQLEIANYQLTDAHCSLQDLRSRVATHFGDAGLSQISGLIFNFLSSNVRSLFGSRKRTATPIRLPRHFPSDRLVVPYNQLFAWGQKVLRSVRTLDTQNDNLLFFFPFEGQFVVGSTGHVFVARHEFGQIVWSARARDIMNVKRDKNRLTIFAADLQAEQPALHERIITCPKEEDAIKVFAQFEPLLAAAKSGFALAGRARAPSAGGPSSATVSAQRIIAVKVRSASFVDRITLVYSNRTTSFCGSDGGNEATFDLASGENIVKIVIRVENSMVDVVMKSIEFFTSAGRRHGPYGQGSPTAKEKVFEPPADQPNAGLIDLKCDLAVWMPFFGKQCLGPNLKPVWLPTM